MAEHGHRGAGRGCCAGGRRAQRRRMRPSRPPGRGSARLPAVRPACGSGRSVSENILRQRTGPANVRTRARPILTCTRKPLRKLPYLASSDRRGCLAGPRRTAALAMRSCRAAQSQTTRADQGGHLRVERPLCGVWMRDSAVGGEGCCCADKGRSHVIMEDSVLFSSLPGRHGGVHSHRQPDQRPPVRDLQHARHTHEAHTDLSTRQHRGANAPWRAWVVGSPARRSHVSMPFWTSTSSRLSLAIRAARATARLIRGASGGGEAALDHADLGAGHGGVVHGDAVGAADAPALSVERLSQLRGAAAVRGG